MIPRTVKVAAAVKSTLSTPQYLDYGNVILNGYTTTASGVATAGAIGAIDTLTISSGGTNYTNGTYTGVMLAGSNGNWAYADITVAGGIVTVATLTTGGSGFVVGQVLTLGAIPRTAAGIDATVTVATVNTRSVQPVLKGWTTNYSSYYTELAPPAAYQNTYPGMNSANFEYIVHSFKPPTGIITAIGFVGPMGYGYTDGVYTNVGASSYSFGAGATLNLLVSGGQVQSVTINNPGDGYARGGALSIPVAIGPGTGFSVVILGINVTSLGGDPYWSQPPVNAQRQVNSLFPLPGVGGWIYPKQDIPTAPPIDTLA